MGGGWGGSDGEEDGEGVMERVFACKSDYHPSTEFFIPLYGCG